MQFYEIYEINSRIFVLCTQTILYENDDDMNEDLLISYFYGSVDSLSGCGIEI